MTAGPIHLFNVGTAPHSSSIYFSTLGTGRKTARLCPSQTEMSTNPKSSKPTASASAKKPYQKPAFRHERVFEQSALACGKVNATQSGCQFNRKKS